MPLPGIFRSLSSSTLDTSVSECVQKNDVNLNPWLVFLLNNSKPGTDEDFQSWRLEEHYMGISPSELLLVYMITLFPIDNMRCICLETVEWMPSTWRRGSLTKKVPVGAYPVRMVDERLKCYQKYISLDFQLQCRALSQVDLWKENEFCQVLLY